MLLSTVCIARHCSSVTALSSWLASPSGALGTAMSELVAGFADSLRLARVVAMLSVALISYGDDGDREFRECRDGSRLTSVVPKPVQPVRPCYGRSSAKSAAVGEDVKMSR